VVGLCVGFCGRLGEGWPTCDTQIKSSNSQMDGLGSIRKNNRHSFHYCTWRTERRTVSRGMRLHFLLRMSDAAG
jgi:hypothetical protein